MCKSEADPGFLRVREQDFLRIFDACKAECVLTHHSNTFRSIGFSHADICSHLLESWRTTS